MNFFKIFGRKGQTEIIGLAIVVLILVFALVFFAKIKSDDNDNQNLLIRNNLKVNSALNALMKSSVAEKKQVKDVINDCFENVQGACLIANNALGNNFELLENRYYFIVYNNGNSPANEFTVLGNDCTGNSISSSPYIFKSYGKAQLKYCLSK